MASPVDMKSSRSKLQSSTRRKMASLNRHGCAVDMSAISAPDSRFQDWDRAGRSVGDAGLPGAAGGWTIQGMEHSAHDALPDPQTYLLEGLAHDFHASSGGPVSSSPFQELAMLEDDGGVLSSMGGSVSRAQGSLSTLLPDQSPTYLPGAVGSPVPDPDQLAPSVDGIPALPISGAAFSSHVGSFPCSSPLEPVYEVGSHGNNGPVLSPAVAGFYGRPPSSASMTRSISTYSVQNDFGLPLAAHFSASMEFSASSSGYNDAIEMSRVGSELTSSLSSDTMPLHQVMSTASVSCGDLDSFYGGPVDPSSLMQPSQDRLVNWPETTGSTPAPRERGGQAALSVHTGQAMFPQSSQMARCESWHRSPASEQPNVPRAKIGAVPASGSLADTPDEDLFHFSPTNAAASRRLSDDSDLGAVRNHRWYHAPQAQDGLYHCPLEGQEGCHHRPETLKCNYHKHIDSHLKPYRCKVSSCSKQQFSSTACLLRHEREAHGMHGHGDKPFSCPYKGCERSEPGNGFPRKWNLADHKRRVHDREGQSSNNNVAPAVSNGTLDAQAATKRKAAVTKRPKQRRNSKSATACKPTTASSKSASLASEHEAGYHVFSGPASQPLPESLIEAAPAMRATQSFQGDGHQLYPYLDDPRSLHFDTSFIPRSELLPRDYTGMAADRSGAGFNVPFLVERM